MKKVITTGKTVEDATHLALQKLGVDRQRVSVKIVTQPTRGLFGFFGSREAEVEVEVLPDPVGEAKIFLEQVVSAMNLEVEVRQIGSNTDRQVTFELYGKQLGLLIGKRGQTLDSLQYLVNLIANKHSNRFVRIQLDAEGYRERRKETLERLADRLAQKAVSTKRRVVLEPMIASERKVIHSYLQDHPHVGTISEGDEPYRKIVIVPKKEAR